MEKLRDIVAVTAQSDYTLELVFETGERRLFDMKPFFEKKPFTKLYNSPLFIQALSGSREFPAQYRGFPAKRPCRIGPMP
jgi:hypothetical protein